MIKDYILTYDLIHDYRVMTYSTDIYIHSQHAVHSDNILLINESKE